MRMLPRRYSFQRLNDHFHTNHSASPGLLEAVTIIKHRFLNFMLQDILECQWNLNNLGKWKLVSVLVLVYVDTTRKRFMLLEYIVYLKLWKVLHFLIWYHDY